MTDPVSPSGGDRLAWAASPVACEPGAATVAEMLRQAAAQRPDALYVDFLDTQNKQHGLTFGMVLAGAERWARWFADRGLIRGERVALLLPSGEEFLFAFFGTQLAGGIPVPLPFPLSLGSPDLYVASLGRIVASARPVLLCTVPHLQAAAQQLLASVGRGRVVLPGDVTDDSSGGPFPTLGGEDIALVQYTSGPVSTPTGSVLTHRAVLGNVFGLGTALRLTPADIALTWVPLVHDMGLIGGLLTSLYWRFPLHVMPPQTFLMHPSLWLKNITQLKVTLASAPNAGYQFCVRRVQDRQLQGLDLSSWRLALNGAETVHPETVEAFCVRFAGVGFARKAMCPIYGLAENTLVAACPDPLDSYRLAALPGAAPVVSVGRPLAGQELAVLDEAGQVLPEDTEGEVAVRGVCVMSGYQDDAAATRRAIDAEGWLHTGDLGFLQKGELFLTGRRKDLVIKMGRNYYPSDIEELLAGFPGLAGRAMAFAEPSPSEGTDLLVVLVESTAADAETQRLLRVAINGELLSRLGIRADTVVHVVPGTLAAAHDPDRRAQLRQLQREGLLT